MKDGFVTVAAATPNILVADVRHNTAEICRLIRETVGEGAKIIAFPELCITGYTCGDLFSQDVLLEQASQALLEIARSTKGMEVLIFVGLPLAAEGKLYNVAAAVGNGKVLGLLPKSYLPNYGEFYEMRQFQAGSKEVAQVLLGEEQVPFGAGLLFQAENMKELIVSAEICEDVWAPYSPGTKAAMEGAILLVNCSASSEVVGKDRFRRNVICEQSRKNLCGYVYANAGEGESTTDLVFGGHNIIAENGVILEESPRFFNEVIYSEIDVHRLWRERRINTTFQTRKRKWEPIAFALKQEETILTRSFPRLPFVPQQEQERRQRCDEILTIQALSLKKRLLHTEAKGVVVGVSGGLDSTLALLATTKAFDLLGLAREQIIAVTMPCFGTTDRTYRNACRLAKLLGVTLLEIPIAEAVRQHFSDIGHDEKEQDITYENVQARERTQVLMDIANARGMLVIGTGDMSELALGWATYNGDHMSMYGLNASIPKTLVRSLVRHCAETWGDARLREVLSDVVETPVSPELIPARGEQMTQKTEDLVGPYELHDFFLYYMLRFGYPPKKIYRLAREAFDEVYEEKVLLKWLRVFYCRFFSQQFKRSCLPDGPKVGTIALSPRGDLRMPSDASVKLWLSQLEMSDILALDRRDKKV